MGKITKIALVGDSTVCDYPQASRLRGWGQMLPELFDSRVVIHNAARCGMSTRIYPGELWASVLEARPDLVLIQFGHNDSHAQGNPESTDAATDYRDNLRRFVREARDAGVQPVLVTPVRRRLFDADGRPTNELAPYADAMREVARKLSAPLVDLHASSGALFSRLGESQTGDFTVNVSENPDQPGRTDRTHFTAEGARAIARLVGDALAALFPPVLCQPNC
ncbi:lysophospholipase L1-like esterase [Opitutaceae bacterium TAV1]|nr:lysophospholipase L1-like esterase [Opitutaceae bacterium TAV1]